jgi:hypothetical protein
MAIPLNQFLFVKGKHSNDFIPTGVNWPRQLGNVRFRDYVTVSLDNIDDIGDYLPTDSYPALHNVCYDRNAETIGKIVKLERGKNKCVWLRNDLKKLDERENLHSTNEPAYVSGDLKLYFLHGVHIEPQYVHLVQVDHPNPKEVLAVKNVDIRRELIRRVGIEQFVDSLWHKVIDTQGDYVLLDVLLNDNTWSNARFLKMLNPSIGVWHLEGVPNTVQTVEDALTWRNNDWFAHARILT